MALLELMPVIWIGVIWLMFLVALFTESTIKCAAEGILAAFCASLIGVRPWIQVTVFLLVTAIIWLFRCLSNGKQSDDCLSGLLLELEPFSSAPAMVIADGKKYSVHPNCVAGSIQCGDIVYLIRDPDGELHFLISD